MIQTNGFRIVSPGDPSVGIFSSEWELPGAFFFDEQSELEEFRGKLKEAFEYIADDCYIETFEERKKYLNEEREMFRHLEEE